MKTPERPLIFFPLPAFTSLRFAASTIEAVSFTSSDGSNASLLPCSALAAKRGLIRDAVSARSGQSSSKRKSGKSAIFILGGGSPKNFALQTEPQIQEVLGIDERGHDYFLQITDARPDTGGLSGATPGEAVSWGKVDPDRLPDAVVCYLDSTVALPIICAYALARHKPRPPRRLYDRREEFMRLLLKEYEKSMRR